MGELNRCPHCLRAYDPIEFYTESKRQRANPLIDALCTSFCISQQNLLPAKGARSYSFQRKVGYWIARNELGWSFNEISAVFRRDRGTVISGVKWVDQNMAKCTGCISDVVSAMKGSV